jgi:hypothetical protein
MGDLAKGVDTAVGPPGADHNRLLAGQARERILDRRLDRRAMRLPLPAVEFGAVIFDEKAVARHRATSRQSGRGRNRVTAEEVVERQDGLAFELDKQRPDRRLAAGDGQPVIE